jgi:HD-GYP domain-containing protein (c-di-GMP phosphodiesterase class II)
MKFPIFRKKIHLRLIRRLATVFILAAILITAAALYLEYKRLDKSLLRVAQKESTIFSSVFATYHENPELLNPAALRLLAAAGMERSSYLQVELFSASREQVLLISRESGADAASMFAKKGIDLPFTSQPDGVRLLANKRIFLQTLMPIHDSNDSRTIGYFKGIYQVSLEDMHPLISRFLWTAGLGVTGVLLCTLLIYPGMVFLSNHLIRNSAELNKANGFLLRTLGSALAKTDAADSGHNHRVLIYGVRLAEQQGVGREQIRSLIHGSFLHDVGMLPISIETLQSQGELDEDARGLIKKHPKTGTTLIKKFRWLRSAEPVIRCHHENYDGSGYPAGLAHEKIPFISRIFTIADVFDALSSTRPGRDARPLPEALTMMEKESGTHFDPVLLSAFLEVAPQLYKVLANLEMKQLDRELDKVIRKYVKI